MSMMRFPEQSLRRIGQVSWSRAKVLGVKPHRHTQVTWAEGELDNPNPSRTSLLSQLLRASKSKTRKQHLNLLHHRRQQYILCQCIILITSLEYFLIPVFSYSVITLFNVLSCRCTILLYIFS